MIRTQISLTPEQMAGLRRLANERRISLAATLREAVDDVLDRADRRARRERALRAIATLSRQGPSDLAEAHDQHLDEGSG